MDSPGSITNSENLLQGIANELHDKASCLTRAQAHEAPSADGTETPNTTVHQEEWGKHAKFIAKFGGALEFRMGKDGVVRARIDSTDAMTVILATPEAFCQDRDH
jgi:hypothetical protein